MIEKEEEKAYIESPNTTRIQMLKNKYSYIMSHEKYKTKELNLNFIIYWKRQ
jgi:hypothetical protein